ncbi:MAG: acetyl-CoA carboxylase biotin carboxyl carrier protein, partial [Sarcina sp.]
MKLNEIKELIDKIDDSNIAYFEVKLDDGYVKMDKSLTRNFSEEKKQTISTISNEVDFKKKEVSEYNVNSEYSTDGKCDNSIFDEDVYYIKSP